MNTNSINKRIVASFFCILIVLMLAVIAAPKGEFVLVVTNPFEGELGGINAIGNAGGSYVNGSNIPWINIAHSEDLDFASKLMRSGAWLVANHNLALGCVRI